MGSTPWYATRESVKTTLDVAETAHSNAQIDRAIAAASRAAEALLHRVFYPRVETKFFNWPNGEYARSWRLWLGQNELISLSSISSGGVEIPEANYFLEPNEFGPPYDRVEIDLDSSSAFGSAGTHQRAISIAGTWGYADDNTVVGLTVEALDASDVAVDMDGATAAQVGVGSVLKVDSERMLVTNRTNLSSGQTIQSDLDRLDNDLTVSVTDGTAFAMDEVILVDSEKMRIIDIAGNSLTVVRSWDGSVLATHTTGATIYAYRAFTVARGALGTTATAHDSGATVMRWDPPPLLNSLVIAEAITILEHGAGGYSRSSRQSEVDFPATGRGLTDLRAMARAELGRQARLAAT